MLLHIFASMLLEKVFADMVARKWCAQRREWMTSQHGKNVKYSTAKNPLGAQQYAGKRLASADKTGLSDHTSYCRIAD
jgi:hypothetical protein